MGTEATSSLVEVLGRVPLFQVLPRDDLERIAEIVKEREIGSGEFLFREGDPADRLYIVADGEVEIVRERPLGDHERLSVKRAGEAFGEKSLLYDADRSVSARARDGARLLTVGREDFEALLGGDSLPVRLMRGLARTVRGVDARSAREGTGESDAFRSFSRLVLQGLEPANAPQAEGFRIAGAIAREPAGGSGALWDGLVTGDGRTILSLMDVKGTGLPPAYLIAITRALIHEIVPGEPFDRVLRRLNAAVFDNLFEGLDECVETALVEAAGGRLRWACAGEQPGVILHPDGTVEEAPALGPPLGILPAFDYGARTLDLKPGDTLLAFTGAAPGMVKGAIEAARGRSDSDPAELARLLQGAVQQVQGRGGRSDLAFLIVRKL